MAQPRSPAITIAFKADSFMYLKTLAVLARPLLQVLQPVGVGGDAWIECCYGYGVAVNMSNAWMESRPCYYFRYAGF